MAKLTLNDVGSLNNTTTAKNNINNNSTLIEAALENTLSRNGTSPNTMGAQLDMNSNKVVNLAAPTANSDAARKIDVDNLTATAAASATAALASEVAAGISETNAAASEAAAGTSATNALASETAAGTSATNAGTSATNAGTSATNALASETAAGTSATNAAASEATITSGLYQLKPSEGAFANGDKTKLDGIEALADVTDATNVKTALAAAGNVGIGISAPSAPLDVRSDGLATGSKRFIALLDVSGISNFLSTDPVLYLNNSGAGDTGIHFRANTADYSIRATDSGELLFEDDAVERMRIDSSGNVGIGTAAPAQKLDVSGSIAATSIYATGGTTASTPTYTWGGQQTHTGMYLPSDKTIAISTDAVERMRIDSSGNVMVGGTTAGGRITAVSSVNDLYSGKNGATAKFTVSNAGTVYAVSTSISSISDIRYKENVRDLDVGLDKIMALKPRLYDWKEGKGADIKNARGFIAQEFEQVFPDLVDEWKEAPPEGEEPYKSVRQDLIPVLVKAIQELKAIIDAQQEQINSLLGKGN